MCRPRDHTFRSFMINRELPQIWAKSFDVQTSDLLPLKACVPAPTWGPRRPAGLAGHKCVKRPRAKLATHGSQASFNLAEFTFFSSHGWGHGDTGSQNRKAQRLKGSRPAEAQRELCDFRGRFQRQRVGARVTRALSKVLEARDSLCRTLGCQNDGSAETASLLFTK